MLQIIITKEIRCAEVGTQKKFPNFLSYKIESTKYNNEIKHEV